MTKDAAKPGNAVGNAVAGWPLRRKMALALAVPLLLAVILGGWRVVGDYEESSNAGTSAQQVKVLDPAVRYLTAAETAMVAAQSGGSGQGDVLDAVDDLAQAAEDLEETAKEAELTDEQQTRVDSLLELSQVTRGGEAADLGPAAWVSQARQMESGVTQLISSVNAALDTPEPRLEQLSQTVSGRLSLAMQQAKVASGLNSPAAMQDLYSELGVEAAAIDRMAGSIDGMDEQTAALRTANAQHASEIRDGADTDLGGRDAYLPYDEITENLTAGVEKSLNDAASEARNSALLNALFTGVMIAAAIALALYITKLLLEPIGRVREGALSVARQKLPDAVARIRAGDQPEEIEPIDVHTDEEIGQVARAVDDLHRQAIHLASGEAQLRQTVNAMFVTLSRRSNSLVNQQLAQIERLEQNEEDPKRLESLFRLDHLASRMRRTADSLLILADAPSRSAGSFSLTVGESLQAATSGVQDYQRVQILSHLGTQISEEASADVVHLLTELVDNALTFSPPSELVQLDAALDGDGATITVIDAGLGVPDSELSQLNADLSHGSEATPDTARRMGLFVVSRLSERHGINASLTKNDKGGVTATVRLPASVLPELPQTGKPAQAPTAKAAPATKPETAASSETSAAKPAAASAVAAGAAAAAADKAGAKAEETRRKSRSERAAEKAAEREAARKAAEDKAAAERAAKEAEKPATPRSRPSAAELLREPEVTPDRPPLESLVARREPGANMPRTGADAFLPPETSTATGPLFGKRSTPATPATREEKAADEAAQDDSTVEASTEPAAEREESAPASLAEGAEKVAPVVPITALAARQRQQAEDEADMAADDTAADAETDATARKSDPLTDPLPADEDSTPVDDAQQETAEDEAPQGEASDDDESVDLDENDPLGLGLPSDAQSDEVKPDEVEDADAAEAQESEQAADEPAAEEPAAEETVEEPVAEQPQEPAAAAGDLPQRSRGGEGGKSSIPGLPASASEVIQTSSADSPIFKSMRSGWLATPGEGEWHETEVDRGWERAEEVAEETPVVESTPVGLPRRQPGQRLVPGSVSQPTGTKTRDPEAIKRRLQAHSAGVKRGRRAATSSTQHTEAGPA